MSNTYHTPITDAELAELERMVNAATKGKWKASGMGFIDRSRGESPRPQVARAELQADAKAIAALHNAFPAMLARIKEKQ